MGLEGCFGIRAFYAACGPSGSINRGGAARPLQRSHRFPQATRRAISGLAAQRCRSDAISSKPSIDTPASFTIRTTDAVAEGAISLRRLSGRRPALFDVNGAEVRRIFDPSAGASRQVALLAHVASTGPEALPSSWVHLGPQIQELDRVRKAQCGVLLRKFGGAARI